MMGWDDAWNSSPLSKPKESVWGKDIGADKVDNPGSLKQVVDNQNATAQGIFKYLEPAMRRQREESKADDREFLGLGAGYRNQLNQGLGSTQIGAAKGGGSGNLVGSYRSFNPANERADALYDAAFSSNRNEYLSRRSDERKAENDQAIAKSTADASKFGATEARVGQQAMANAQLGAAKAAADAAKYGATEQARAGIFGSLFGAISNANVGGFRYW